jgi:hypothetical protein
MKPSNLFFAGALAGAGAFALASSLLQSPEPTQGAPIQDAQSNNLLGQQAAQPKDHAFAAYLQKLEHQEAKPANSVASEPSGGPMALAPGTDFEWSVLVGGMLEWQVERRTGQKMSAQQRDRLLAELARLRDASLALQEAPSEPDDPAELRERLTRTLALVQVDETFRRELGVGVADFLKGIDPHAVEDVSSALGQQ